MIRVYILKTESLQRYDFSDLVDALPFGDEEKTRLLGINSSKHRWESLGGLVALSRLLDKYPSECSHFSTVIRRAPSGKPFFESPTAPFFGISHSRGIAAAAMVDYKYGEIGFDVEIIDESYDLGRVAERFFNEAERSELAENQNSASAFFSIWTAKEAYAKIDGRGLSAVMAGKEDGIVTPTHTSRLYVDIGERRAVMSVCSYVADQPIQIYTDK